MSEPLKLPLHNNYTCNGRVTRDPEIMYTREKNTAICKFGIAINVSFNKRDDGKDDAVFIDVKTFGDLAEKCNTLKKGMPVMVLGGLGVDRWIDKNTQQPRERLYIKGVSVQRMSWDKNLEDESNGAPRATQVAQASAVVDDDLPF